MQIRRGKAEEIDKIMRIYEQARAFMRKTEMRHNGTRVTLPEN